MKGNKKYQKIMKNVKKYLICVDKSSIIIINFQKVGKNEVRTPLSKSKRKKCYVNVVDINNGVNKNDFSCREIKGVKKEVKNMDVLCAAKYLIGRFFEDSANGCFSVSRTKIEKLLTIAALVFMRDGETLFDALITVNACGTGIPKLSQELLPLVSNNIPTDEIPAGFKMMNPGIDDKISKLLNDVYKDFGAFEAVDLGKMLDEFKNEISDEDGAQKMISVNNAARYFGNREKVLLKNKIVKFVYNYVR